MGDRKLLLLLLAASALAGWRTTNARTPPSPASAVTPRVQERCEGQATAPDGERCVQVTRSESQIECRYRIARVGPDERGRDGKESETTTVTMSSDGSLTYNYETRDARTWSRGARRLETETVLESRYRETAAGVGLCPSASGGEIECERRDIILPGDPCTSEFLR